MSACLLKGYSAVSLCPLTANLGFSLSLLPPGKTGLAPVSKTQKKLKQNHPIHVVRNDRNSTKQTEFRSALMTLL